MYTYQIQYQDLDQNMRLRIYTLENILLNAASQNAYELGIGVDYLFNQNCTWVLTNLSLEMHYLPTVGEMVEIDTWVEQNIHMLSIRNFRLHIGDKLVGQAKSVWAIINLTDRTAQNLFDQDVFSRLPLGEKLNIARAKRMQAFSQDEQESIGIGRWPHKVQYSDIDYNGHCNSCKYLEFMLNACEPMELKKSLPAKVDDITASGLRIDIKYAREIHRGEDVIVYFKQENQQIAYEIRTKENDISCQALIARF